MANTLSAATQLWTCDTAAAVTTAGAIVTNVYYVPSAANDDLIITDQNDVNAIILKAGASDATPVQISFGEDGRYLNGLKIGTIDGGTAYIYLKKRGSF